MSVASALGVNPSEINKYDIIDNIGYFAIGVYHSAKHKEPLLAFEHHHDEYEFAIPITTIHLLQHENYKVIGEVGFIYPFDSGNRHGTDHDMNRTNFATIVISKDYLLERAKGLGYKTVKFVNRMRVDMVLFGLIKDFQKAVREEFPNQNKIADLANGITDWLIDAGQQVKSPRFVPQRPYDPNIRKVMSYMFKNYSDPSLNLDSLASYCGYSPAYFSRVFKQYVGDSPITHLNKIRISEARSMCYNDKLSLSEIAELVGFKNLSTFTEAFKKLSGDKPKKYRDKRYK